MCTCDTTVLETLDDAHREISLALSQGNVACVLATVQCLWIFCSDGNELNWLLDNVLVAAGRFRDRLTSKDAWQLAEGISQAKLDYLENVAFTKERLLAGAAA